MSWTRASSNDAFLVLDRNENGIIDSGVELFGGVTPQPSVLNRAQANGFRALAVFDEPSAGGNGDGQITVDDAVYASLKLWFDTNHDGVSQSGELRSLEDVGVSAISLHYVTQKKADEFGNLYRYRSLVTMDRDMGRGPSKRRATDVVLTHLGPGQ